MGNSLFITGKVSWLKTVDRNSLRVTENQLIIGPVMTLQDRRWSLARKMKRSQVMVIFDEDVLCLRTQIIQQFVDKSVACKDPQKRKNWHRCGWKWYGEK